MSGEPPADPGTALQQHTDAHVPAFDARSVGVAGDTRQHHVTEGAMCAYAAATDDALGGPVFAIVPVWETIAPASRSVASDEARTRVVHYEHDIVLHRPIELGDILTARATPIALLPRPNGTSLVIHVETLGAALRSSGMRAGQTVAIFGVGGVGLSMVQGARLGGARQIIAVDQFESKLEMARGLGATHTVSSTQDDPVKAIRAMTGGLGVDHAFEAVGNAKLCRQAIESLAVRGTATIVGVLPPDAMIEFPWLAIRPECKVQTSRMGSNQFRTDIPNYLEFYRQGRLDLDGMISRRGRLGDINDAFRAMKAGEVARTVLMFD